MPHGARTIIYPVSDAAAAAKVFEVLLGQPPTTQNADYVGFELNDQQIGLDPHGYDHGMTGPTVYFHVDDINATLADLRTAGANINADPQDVGGGRLITTVTDADGNLMGVLQDPRS